MRSYACFHRIYIIIDLNTYAEVLRAHMYAHKQQELFNDPCIKKNTKSVTSKNVLNYALYLLK